MDLLLSDSYSVRSNGRFAVVPFGSVEQHCRAPLGTDTIIVGEIARRVCRELEDKGCVLLPVMPYGFSPEWLGSPGTVSLRLSTFARLVRDLLDSLYRSGFRFVVLLNGHGGNSGLLEAVAREWVREHMDSAVLVVDYWRPLGARLGHCDENEERLLNEIMPGQKCDCERSVRTVKGARLIRLPDDPSGTGMRGYKHMSMEEIVEGIVETILEAMRERGMSL